MISRKASGASMASAVGGKTARACDNCIRKRARWYCAADDAFLCQACDGSVHSANPLARRHERVRLKTSSHKHLTSDFPVRKEYSGESWHHGFTKKARTPRHGKGTISFKSIPLVPEVGEDNTSNEENDEQLLYRVPAYDPLVAELCTSVTSKDASKSTNVGNNSETITINRRGPSELGENCGPEMDHLEGFLPSDRDLAEFAADVESLLGRELENESFCMEGLGLIDCNERDSQDQCSLDSRNKVKVEEEEVVETKDNVGVVETGIDMIKESFELNFDYDSPASCGEEEIKVVNTKTKKNVKCCLEKNGVKESKKRKILLRLDYEAVITAWASRGSPWTDGGRPDLNPDVSWPDFLGLFGTEVRNPYGDRGYGGHMGIGDAGREAKVSRYREKRRTRLFSKKIRYEVRKLNAEKRPRMKGRFVKRTSFGGPTFPLLNM